MAGGWLLETFDTNAVSVGSSTVDFRKRLIYSDGRARSVDSFPVGLRIGEIVGMSIRKVVCKGPLPR